MLTTDQKQDLDKNSKKLESLCALVFKCIMIPRRFSLLFHLSLFNWAEFNINLDPKNNLKRTKLARYRMNFWYITSLSMHPHRQTQDTAESSNCQEK